MIAKYSLFLFTALLIGATANAQQTKKIAVNKTYAVMHINATDSASFTLALKKDNYYTITVEQQGIDLVVDLRYTNGVLIQEMDSPNGMFGPEKIDFLPDSTAEYLVTVKPLTDSTNARKGDYTIQVKDAPKTLQRYTKQALLQDLEVLRNGLIETHVGLWYNTYIQFDSIYNAQKEKVKDNMTALEFYRVVAPFITFIKEGHSNVKPAEETSAYLKQYGTLFPFFIKVLHNKVYVINDLPGYTAKGYQLLSINGRSADSILYTFLTIEPADGYNYTSKYRWIETAFSRYYQRFYESPATFNVVLQNPVTNETIAYHAVPAMNTRQFSSQRQKVAAAIPAYNYKEAMQVKLDTALNLATITVNTFNTNNFKGGREGFKKLLDKAFSTIKAQQIQHLVIDVRKNEGGAQGMEDHLLSYLVTAGYAKYSYVELPAFSYAFYPYTDYKGTAQQQPFEADLHNYFYPAADGRNIDRPGKYKGDSPAANAFTGDLYILISGLTFSGGSEFAALAKNYTHATFIGEEAGGGYYGNTSGEFLQFTLPNSKLLGRIPLFKFVIVPKDNGIPFGHGVLPDYEVQSTIAEYLSGTDAEMEQVKKMIRTNR